MCNRSAKSQGLKLGEKLGPGCRIKGKNDLAVDGGKVVWVFIEFND